MTDEFSNRRDFFRVSTVASTGLLLAGAASTWAADPKAETKKAMSKSDQKASAKDAAQPKPEEDVSPAEDLMREHGVLKRVMLVYDEVLHRWDKKEEVPPEILAAAAGMIRHFVEDYHEKLEEDYLFPRFEKANKLTDLVKTLKAQHQAGRKVTDIVIQRANAKSLKDAAERAKSPRPSASSIACMPRTKPAKTPCCSRPSADWYRPTNTIRWAKISRRKRTSCSAQKVLKKWSTKSPALKSNSASTTWRNLRPRCEPAIAAWPGRVDRERRVDQRQCVVLEAQKNAAASCRGIEVNLGNRKTASPPSDDGCNTLPPIPARQKRPAPSFPAPAPPCN